MFNFFSGSLWVAFQSFLCKLRKRRSNKKTNVYKIFYNITTIILHSRKCSINLHFSLHDEVRSSGSAGCGTTCGCGWFGTQCFRQYSLAGDSGSKREQFYSTISADIVFALFVLCLSFSGMAVNNKEGRIVKMDCKDWQ